MTHTDYEEVHRIAREAGILLFSDEVYRESELDPGDRLPAACDVGEHAVSLGVMSKTYGLAGLRLGWIATGNEEVRTRMAELKDYTTICTSAPSEFLAEVALRHRSRFVERNVGIIRGNLDLLDRFFERFADRFSWVRPRAGSIAFPKLLRGNVEDLSRSLVREAGVLILPGPIFNDRDNHFRVGFGRTSFQAALAQFEAYVANHLG